MYAMLFKMTRREECIGYNKGQSTGWGGQPRGCESSEDAS